MKAHVSLRSLVDRVERRDPARLASASFPYIDIASIDRKTKTIAAATFLPSNAAPSRARQLVRTNDVLVSTVRPNLNSVARIDASLDGAIASTGFCVLRPKPNLVHPKYLFYFTQSKRFVGNLSRIANGANYPAVSDDDVLNELVLTPSVDRQAELGLLLSEADALRSTRRAALQHCDDLLSAAFVEMFGDPRSNPKGWGLVEIDDLLEWSQYGTWRSQRVSATG